MYRRLCGAIVLVASLVISGSRVYAQAGPTASLSTLDTSTFPVIQAYLDVLDGQGQFIHGLQPDEVSIIEDSVRLPVQELRELRPGVQVVVAFDPGTSFAIRDSQGTSRGQKISTVLSAWAKSRLGSTIDDLSLVITNGTEASHLADPAAWLNKLKFDYIDFHQVVPSMDTLFRAVEIAGDQTTRPGMGRAVLYITTPNESLEAQSVENVIASAQAQNVNIFVWMVPVPGAYYPNAEKHLQEITNQTGGQLFAFSDDQPLPSIEDLIDPLRSTYHLAYNSMVRTSGSHQTAAEIKVDTETISTPIQSFQLSLMPPEPAFVSPPLEIIRKPPAGQGEDSAEEIPLAEYTPDQQELQTIVGFPDERARQIVRTSLFVDGKLVQENRQPPFDRFQWDLRTYTTTVPHLIRVEAEDNLGLVGTSIERLVQLTVDQPPRDPWSWVYRNAGILSVLAAAVTGLILLLILLLGGRLRPRVAGLSGQVRRYNDPVTQPVPIKVEAPARRLTTWVNRIHWPQRQIHSSAYAYLSRIGEGETPTPLSPLPITAEEMTIGSDPSLATLVLQDSSVEGLHARLVHQPNGAFRISDQGSIAGTWINYMPISREGVLLEHGDLIHIGRVGFRFTLAQPTQVRRPVITQAVSQETDKP